MILQTKIENLTNSGRNLTYLGKRGHWVNANDTIIVEGAYPTACRRPACAQEMQTEIELGRIRASLITDMTILSPEEAEVKELDIPEITVEPEAKAEEVETGVTEEPAALAYAQISKNPASRPEGRAYVSEALESGDQAFIRGSAEDGLPPAYSLDHGESEIPKPKTVPIFGDEPVPETLVDEAPAAEGPLAVEKEKPVKKPARKPAAKKDAAKKPAAKKAAPAKKTRTRKKKA